MNQRTFLELTHNPFTPPREGFYPGADRQTHLDHIRHLSQWSRRILLVTGPFGIGKSTLYRELSNSLEPATKAARLSGNVVTGERDVLLALAQGFGVAVDQDAHAEDILKILSRRAEEEAGRQCTCMIMIDDAQLLSHQAVDRLIQLVAESQIRLVMFTEATLIANVTRAAREFDLEWFEIRLTGFPAADVREYLEWRFAQAQYRGRLPFTDAQLEKIVSRSGGNPNVVDFMANELLSDLETGEVRRSETVFPKQHVVLALVLFVLLGITYQLYQTSGDADQRALDIAAADANSTGSAGTDGSGTGAPEAGVGVPGEVGQEADQSTEAVGDTAVSTAVRARSIESAAAQARQQAPAEVEPPLPQVDDGEDEVVAAGSVQSAPEAVTLPPAEPITGEADATAATGSAPVPVIEAGSPAQIGSSDGVKGARWVLQQAPEDYTLQLMTLSRREGGVALIKRQSNADDFAMVPVERDDKVMHLLIYGAFSSRAAAQRAADEMGGELAEINPWIRTFEGIQRSLP